MSDSNLFLTRDISLLQRGSYSLASQGINSATNFLSSILLGRFCSKEEYGLYALGFTLVMYFTEFQTAFISTPYMVYSPRLDGDDQRQYTGSVLVHQLFLAALSSLLLIMGSAIVSSSIGPGGLLKVLKILSLVIVFIMLKEFIRQLCFARLNTKAAFGVDASAALIQLTGLSILVYIGLLSAEIVFAISGVACGLTVSWWLIANKDVFILQLKKALPDFHQNWSFVKWVVASHILWASAMSLYPWLIAAFLGVEANGVWAACLSIIMIGNLICVAVQNMLGPKIVYAQARGAVSELRSTVFRSAFYFSLIMIAICLVFVSMGNFLVVFFYGQEYDGNGAIVSLLAMNLVVQSTTFPFSRGLFALERTDIDFVVNMAVVLSLIVGIWLIRSYDLIGAALGVLAANSLSTLLRGIAFARLTTTECPTVKTEARKKAGLT